VSSPWAGTHQYHPAGHDVRPAAAQACALMCHALLPAVSLTTLTFVTVLAVVKPGAAPRERPERVRLLIFSAVVSDGVEPVRSQGERPATADQPHSRGGS